MGSAATSVIILTFNEEMNVEHALRSVVGWSDDVHVVDCGSTDKTTEIARTYTPNVHFHPWSDWAAQRQWAQDNLPLKYDWVLFLDADEQLTDQAAEEIAAATRSASDDLHGFVLPFDFIFLGARIRNGMHPHLRLVRRQHARWKCEGAREYCAVPGRIGRIRSRLIHDDRRGISCWIEKQNRNASREAALLLAVCAGNPGGNGKDHQGILRGWVRRLIWRRIPVFLRPLLSFGYRLMLTFSLRNPLKSFAYAFFFGLWYPMLIEANYIELRSKAADEDRVRDNPSPPR